MKVLAASALVATTLVGCSSGSSAKYAKVGFGMVISYDEDAKQQTATTATVGLDSDGKIAYVDVDATYAPNDHDSSKTKKELKEDYGMKGASAAKGAIEGGKEWYEQADAFEKFCVGKTVDEVSADIVDGYAKEGSDLASGCTIAVSAFQTALSKAVENAVEVEADKVGAGEIVSYSEEDGKVTSSIVAVALDTDGKVVWCNLDSAYSPNGVDETKSKKELKEDYGMKSTSAGIGKIDGGGEWYEQAAAFEEYCKGKTADEIAATEVENGKAKEGTDLAAGCTIAVTDFLAAVAEACAAAQ